MALYIYYWKARDLNTIYSQKPLFIGHRGARYLTPENTLASFRKAIENGLSAIELDVLQAKDGKIVCSHNYDLERETDGGGFIDEMDYSELKLVKTRNDFPSAQQEKIPLLTEVVESLPETMLLNIEIKTKSRFDLNTAFKVARMVKRGEIPQKVIISSFNPLAVLIVKFISRSIPTGFIYYKAKDFKGVFIARPNCLHPMVEFINDDLIQFCRKRNIRINTWTVNNLYAKRWLTEKGIDGIITDHPALTAMEQI